MCFPNGDSNESGGTAEWGSSGCCGHRIVGKIERGLVLGELHPAMGVNSFAGWLIKIVNLLIF